MSNHGGLAVFVGLFVTLGLPAQNSPEVVARWNHLGNPIALYSNGKINDTSSENTWSKSGNTLTLRWKDAKAPGGFWVDTCTISPDGRSFKGTNQLRRPISGTLISEVPAAKPASKVDPMVGAGGKANETKKSPGKSETASRPTGNPDASTKTAPKSTTPAKQPVSEPGRAVLADYRELARTMSNVYGINGKRIAPETRNIEELLSRLGKSRNSSVRTAVERLQEGRKNAADAVRQVQAGADSARQMQMSVYEDAANGVFSRQVIREQVITNSDGTTRVVRTLETIDDSGLPVFGATLLNGWVQANAPEEMRKRAALAMENARLEAWLELVGVKTIRSFYPDNRVKSKAVRFRITPPDSAANLPAKFEAVNASGIPLTDVTLSVVLVHFTTAPEPTVLQVYFIPRWEAGQALQLPTAVVRNIKTREFELGRPTAANPAGDHPDSRASERRPWLAGPGGITAVYGTLYSAELQQPAETFPFPEQAEEGARWEIKKAADFTRVLVMAQLRSLTKQTFPKLEDAPKGKPIKLPETYWEIRAARRVIAFAPEGSDAIRQAKLLIDNPVALLREMEVGARGKVSKLVAPGAILEGEWTFDLKGFGVGVPGEVQRAALAMKNAKGKIALRINTVKGSDVTATLYSPDQPDVKREIKGHFGEFGLTFLPGVTARNGSDFTPDQLHPVKSPGGIQLGLDGSGLRGSAAGYPYPKCYEFLLTFKLAKK